MGWTNNAWVVGIGGGILSGIFVAWITHRFLQRSVNKEYREKIASANRDVIYAIRPGISEGQIPTLGVIEALVHATARRHGIVAADMYGPRQIAEELIKEVMDTSFLSSAKKSEYCGQLVPLQQPIQVETQAESVALKKAEASTEFADYRAKTTQWVSVLLGLITAMMGMFSTFYIREGEKGILENKQFLFIVLMAIMVLISMMFVYLVSMRVRRSRQDQTPKDLREFQEEITKVETDKKSVK